MNSSSYSCDLCGLPIRHGLFTSESTGKTYRFCCMGCRQVFKILEESSGASGTLSFKETELFKRCQKLGIIPRSEAELAKGPVHIPPGDFHHLKREGAEERLTLDLRVANMWCPACAWVIEAAMMKNPGVTFASCNFSTDRVRCEYDPLQTSQDRIIQSIESLGYKAFLPGEGMPSAEKTREFIRFGIAAFLTMNIMMLSFALYWGFFQEFSPDTIHKLSWPIFIMASIVLFYGGRHIYQRAINGISSVAFSMETLVTAGSFSAYAYSTINLFSGSLHLYYDTASMLITLVLIGKLLERRAKDKVQEDLSNFLSLRPTKVRICSELYPNGRYMAIRQLQKGDLFRIEENEIIPADGLILEGKGSVDESSLTGEALPIRKNQGDRVRSGTRVIHGVFRIRAEGVGEDSTLGQMIRIMEKALERKSPFEGKTDLMLQWFVPVILTLAAGTGLVCLAMGLTFETSLVRAITVMVISCPCTLGIAVPMARVAGIGMGGRMGILVRDFSAFERSARVNAFVFDKTGTITRGRWSLLDVLTVDHISKEEALSLAVALEWSSDHYIAMEIKRRAGADRIEAASVDRIAIFENGISGYAGEEEVRIGSKAFSGKGFEEKNIPLRDQDGNGQQYSFIYMSFGGRPCAVFIFGDEIKEGTRGAIDRLHAMGYPIAIISGDGEETTRAVGRQIGADEARGGMLPQDKASFINAIQETGKVAAMVGDGVNDAPALVQSGLAFAIFSESHLGKEAGDITLMRGDPGQIIEFIELAHRVNRKIHQNLVWSFLYNMIGIPIAMSGLLTPLIAVSAMLMSSLSVIGNTLLFVKKDL